MTIDTDLSALILNLLTQEQYNNATKNANELYLISNIDNSEIFIATYGATTFEDITTALTANKICICVDNTNSNSIKYGQLILKESSAYYFESSENLMKVSSDNIWTIENINTDETYLTKINPNGTGSLSLNRKSDSTIGINSVTLGIDAIASGNYSMAEGKETTASGIASHAEGEGTVASGNYSHAEGLETIASGIFSHAEGASTLADRYSHAEGHTTKAIGIESHAEGYYTIAAGYESHAEGDYTLALGMGSHAEGLGSPNHLYLSGLANSTTYTIEEGSDSHEYEIGNYVVYDMAYAKILDFNPTAKTITLDATLNPKEDFYDVQVDVYVCGALENGSHTEGIGTTAAKEGSHAEGGRTTASGYYSHAEGRSTTASGKNSHAEGSYTTASGEDSHAEGNDTTAFETGSHAEGLSTIASGYASHAEGRSTTASGEESHAEGYDTTASGNTAHAEGAGNVASGDCSHAEGRKTTASGLHSHAEGNSTTVTNDDTITATVTNSLEAGYYGHAEGYGTVSYGAASHAEGNGTMASGANSHAEGYKTTSSADYSHAEGYNATASGDASHAEGSWCVASGDPSHAEGQSTVASGWGSHSEGRATMSFGVASHSEGYSDEVVTDELTRTSNNQTIINLWETKKFGLATGQGAHSEGLNTLSFGNGSHSEGRRTWAMECSHAEGTDTIAYGGYSHAEGDHTLGYGYASHAEGSGGGTIITVTGSANATQYTVNNTTPIKVGRIIRYKNNFALITAINGTTIIVNETLSSTALSSASAEVFLLVSSGYASHAEGNDTIASGDPSHAEGVNTTASGDASHAEGMYTTASNNASHAEGMYTTASGSHSHASGYYTTALDDQFVIGHYNNTSTGAAATNSGTGTGSTTNQSLFVIGNGTASSAANAFRVNQYGKAYCKTNYSSSGADYAEYFEWEDLNLYKEDRRGYFVTLDGEKIKIAQPGDYILGVISALPAIIGNGDEDWMNRYVYDEFGSFVYEEYEYETPILDKETQEVKMIKQTGIKHKENPDYDPTIIYTPREERPEWDAVGMIGVLAVRDDGTCKVNNYCQVTEGGIATSSENGYRVIKRINDHVIKIVFK